MGFEMKMKFINRRDFMLQSASLMSASLITLPGFGDASAGKYKMGLQLFTVREPLAKDVTGTVKKIASIGYEDCETYGYDPDQVKSYELKATVFKQLFADNNMTATSGPYQFTKFSDKPADAMPKYVPQSI